MISLIVAHDRNGLIGKGNTLPWFLPADLEYFKKITTSKIVVMGRKTFESIGKPLPNRTNIILTSKLSYQVNGCQIYDSISDILSQYKNQELFIIGGESVYRQFLPYTDFMYVTYIDHVFEGDTYFPKYDKEEWILISSQKGIKNEKNPYDYYFDVYERSIKTKNKY